MWADMLAHWAVNTKKAFNSNMGYKYKYLMLAPINAGVDPKLDWPNRDEIIRSQSKSQLNPPEYFDKTKDRFIDENNRLWIPKSEELLKIRILIAAHTGYSGHRSWKVTNAKIRAFSFGTG